MRTLAVVTLSLLLAGCVARLHGMPAGEHEPAQSYAINGPPEGYETPMDVSIEVRWSPTPMVYPGTYELLMTIRNDAGWGGAERSPDGWVTAAIRLPTGETHELQNHHFEFPVRGETIRGGGTQVPAFWENLTLVVTENLTGVSIERPLVIESARVEMPDVDFAGKDCTRNPWVGVHALLANTGERPAHNVSITFSVREHETRAQPSPATIERLPVIGPEETQRVEARLPLAARPCETDAFSVAIAIDADDAIMVSQGATIVPFLEEW